MVFIVLLKTEFVIDPYKDNKNFGITHLRTAIYNRLR